MTTRLTPDMFDAVTEVFNIGVGHAAQSLRGMVRSPVQVSIPHVDILSDEEAETEFSVAPEKFMVGTATACEGGFGGEAMLLLPSISAVNLSRSVLADGTGMADGVTTQDVIEEVGNVLVTACFTKIADVLGVRLASTPPTYLTGMEDIRNRFRAQLSEDVIWFRFRFKVDEWDIVGYIYFLMDPMHTFLHAVQRLVEATIRP